MCLIKSGIKSWDDINTIVTAVKLKDLVKDHMILLSLNEVVTGRAPYPNTVRLHIMVYEKLS